MLHALQNQPNAIFVLRELIKVLNIPVSSFTIEDNLLEHPDYPSLLALSDCLTSWSVPNESCRLNKKEHKIEELPFPFVAHLRKNGGRFILVREFRNGNIRFSDELVSNGSLKVEDFLKIWDGVILHAQKDEESGEKNYWQSLISGWFNVLRLPFLIFVFLIGILYMIDYSSASLSFSLQLTLKFIGILVSLLLLTHGINSSNPFVQNLCSLGKKNNCNSILNSKAAKVTTWLSWSEVGMFYFVGSFVYLLFNPSNMKIMAWLNFLSLPYTFYSIGYQIKIKNWCILCCSIQVILWLEALFFFLYNHSFKISSSIFTLSGLIPLLLCFLFPISIWSFVKPFLIKAGQTVPLKQQLKKFKYNAPLFNQLLSSQAHYAIPIDLMPITLGNPNAKTVVTMVSNPFCQPCAIAHKILNDWLDERDDIQLKILFSTTNHDDDKRTKVAKHITALSLLNNAGLVEGALNDWYGQDDKKYDRWALKYPVVLNGDVAVITRKQKEWCEMVEISSTPTILVDGYKLVQPYRLEDIKFLIG